VLPPAEGVTMTDITQISTEKLLADLEETRKDISLCLQALIGWGITHYGQGQSVEKRITDNHEISLRIRKELARRNER